MSTHGGPRTPGPGKRLGRPKGTSKDSRTHHVTTRISPEAGRELVKQADRRKVTRAKVAAEILEAALKK